MLDAKDFEHSEDEYEEHEYKVKGVNRQAKTDRKERMIENGRGLKSIILPVIAKKAREARDNG